MKKMITRGEYLAAKAIVDKYEAQQIIDAERIKNGDVNLFSDDINLSVRVRNILREYNERVPFLKESNIDCEELIYASDVARAILKDGRVYYGRDGMMYHTFLIYMRGLGRKSHDELMKYVSPFL